jgi:hypothetical protein
MMERFGAGSVFVTNGSGYGSGRSENIRILRIRMRIRIRNTVINQQSCGRMLLFSIPPIPSFNCCALPDNYIKYKNSNSHLVAYI